MTKAPTQKPVGPLHPLPVPINKFDDIAFDFVGPLPISNGFDYLLTITDRLTGFVELIPTLSTLTARGFAKVFVENWVLRYGLPLSITSDRDKLFTSHLWQETIRQLGIKSKMSTSYHPETDGASERTNKTAVQTLRAWVDRRGKSWATVLPRVAFAMNNTVRRGINYAPAQLVFGKRLRLTPSLASLPLNSPMDVLIPSAVDWEEAEGRLQLDIAAARDALLLAKHRQAIQANKGRRPEIVYAIDDLVLLNTRDFRRDYTQKGDDIGKRSAKLFPRFKGPYRVIKARPEVSSYTLGLGEHVDPMLLTTFHSSLLRPYRPNNEGRFPVRGNETSMPAIPETASSNVPRQRVIRIVNSKSKRQGSGRNAVKTQSFKVTLLGEASDGRWMLERDVCEMDGFATALDAFAGEDELALR